jgi:hypothetical protein
MTMKTTRKPAPIQAQPLPAWATQFVRLCDLLAESCATTDDAVNAARSALGCMAVLGSVNGVLYEEVRDAVDAYVEAAVLRVRMTRAYNATPWRNPECPCTMSVALKTANGHYDVERRELEAALRDVRPSLPLT